MAKWQAAEPGTVIGDDKGNYQIRMGGQWVPMPKGSLIGDEHGAYYFDSNAVKPPAAPKAESAPKTEGPPAPQPSTTAKVADAIASNVPGLPVAENVISGLTGGIGSLVDAITGAPPGTHNFAYQPRTSVGKEIQKNVGAVGNQVNEDAAQLGGHFVGLASNPANAQAATDTLRERLPEAEGAVGTVTGAGGALEGGLAARAAASADAAANAPSWAARGYRSAADHPVAAGAAGQSGNNALTLQNQQVGNTSLGADVGVPHGTELTPEAIEKGRAPADAIKGRVATVLPTAPLSPTAAEMVNNIRVNDLVTRSPDAEAIINAQKLRLLERPLTGSEVVDNTRALRQEGYARLASEDVEQQAIGRAQVQASRALEQHIEDTLPENAGVSMDQWRAARVVQAKSSALQASLKGGNVDLKAIGRMGQADPGYLTGAFKDAADFANAHPKVAGLANNIEVPPSFAYDFGNAIRSGGLPQDILGRIFGASGISAGARRVMTGNPANVLEAARQTPVAGLAGEFEPLPLNNLARPPGRAFEPHQPDLATGAPTQQDFFGFGTGGMTAEPPAPVVRTVPGQTGIPLADLLSHGVEQPPAPGLSLGPMGAPAHEGVPFTRNAAHEAGDLELTHEVPQTPAESNQDLGAVMGQGVPEGTVARTAQNPGLKMKVAHSPAFKGPQDQRGSFSLRDVSKSREVPGSGNEESGGASLEAANRGTGNFVYWDGDTARPIARDVNQVDKLTPPKGSVVLNADTGELVSSGSTPRGLVQGLIARWKAKPKLGDQF